METRARYLVVGAFFLVAIGAGAWFVYWLNNAAGFTTRATYTVRFEGPVAGLRPGSAVLFNGIRVGEVTELRLDPASPASVIAAIAVNVAVPLRADTGVSVEAQGLMGAPSVTLRGGKPDAPPLGAAPLVADATASQDINKAAREALRAVQQLVSDNADPLHTTIENLSSFTGALARNSGRFDRILDGIDRMTGGGANKPLPAFDITAAGRATVAANPLPGKLAIAEPTALLIYDTQRVLVQGADGGLSPLEGAQLLDTLPKLLQARIVQAFNRAGYSGRVASPSDNVTPDYQLALEIQSFRILEGNPLQAEVQIAARVTGEGDRMLGNRVFHAAVPVASRDAKDATASLSEAFGQVLVDLLAWTDGLPRPQ